MFYNSIKRMEPVVTDFTQDDQYLRFTQKMLIQASQMVKAHYLI